MHNPEDHFRHRDQHVEEPDEKILEGGPAQGGVGKGSPEPGEGDNLDYTVRVDAHSGVLIVSLNVSKPAPDEPHDSDPNAVNSDH